ncbi:unnamed protein product [Urochloa humidicola]
MEAAYRNGTTAGSSNSSYTDRLSDLPDVILHTILSSLKARQVVQTSVLSKRWRHLWRSVPCLDIDEREFTGTARIRRTGVYDYLRGVVTGPNDREKFEDFTDNLLAHRVGSLLDTLQLHVGNGHEERVDASRWIRRGLKCNPKALHYYDHALSAGPEPILGPNSCHLRKLHLSGVELYGCFGKYLTAVCTLLEVLELKHCRLCVPELVLHTLKDMVIDHCEIDFEDVNPNDEIRITAPRLSRLRIDVVVGEFDILVNVMPSLVKASIHLKHNYHEKMRDNQFQFLCSLFNTTSLDLQGWQAVVMPSSDSVEFPTFKNLRSLLLDTCDLTDNFQLLALFLQKSPNLNKLTVRCCKFSTSSSQFVNLVDLQCGELKTTEIMYKNGDNCHVLVDVLLDISESIPKNIITLTKV